MLPYFTETFGNPSSAFHSVGLQARAAVDKAREQLAALINAEPSEIIFTSGATESNNLAIFGLVRRYNGGRSRLVTTAIEHKAVLEPYRLLAKEEWEVDIVPVSSDGQVDLERVEERITERTLLGFGAGS